MDMQKLAQLTEMEWDGNDDNRLFLYDYPNVNASLMSAEEYALMEKEIEDFELKGKGFKVYCWNDNSSYLYWKDSKMNGYNYCMITVSIENIHEVDPNEVMDLSEKALQAFAIYDNTQQYY